ncbi:MAG: DUF2490 domain-containing protein [Bacteroidota bacterium]|nr:DUF2490 domain-containing protein [Bacteroidota bacterium]
MIVNHQYQSWLGYVNQTRVSSKWGIWFDVHQRFIDLPRLRDFYLGRIGVNYFVNDNIRLSAGHAVALTSLSNSNQTYVHEHRPWEQISQKFNWKIIFGSHWIRIEHRFNQKVKNGELLNEYNFTNRFRYGTQLSIPLNNKTIKDNTISLVFQPEIFINVGGDAGNRYFDQNRFMVALSYNFNKTYNIQLGYINILQKPNTPDQWTDTHTIRLFLNHNIDLRKSD